MWVVFYLMNGWLIDNVYNVGTFPNRDACEHVRVQIDSAFHPKTSACIELQQPQIAPQITPPPPAQAPH